MTGWSISKWPCTRSGRPTPPSHSAGVAARIPRHQAPGTEPARARQARDIRVVEGRLIAVPTHCTGAIPTSAAAAGCTTSRCATAMTDRAGAPGSKGHSIRSTVAGAQASPCNTSRLSRPVYRLGERIAGYERQSDFGEVQFGRSDGLREGWVRRMVFGLRREHAAFAAAPDETAPAALPQDRRLDYPFFRIEGMQDDFETTRSPRPDRAH